jgi:hypothetical protein
MTTHDLQLKAQSLQAFVDAACINSGNSGVSIPTMVFRKFADDLDSFIASAMQEVNAGKKFRFDVVSTFKAIVNTEAKR